ncbi:MAG TPA: nitrate/nitrite transporter NrtS [Candidatus Dormibacteraeota bacterium]|nr:nitrate/nitrite transporter NrtS [Candidatus Dormibacteraeota bacterium]
MGAEAPWPIPGEPEGRDRRPPPPAWARWRDLPGVCLRPDCLKRTVGAAIVVGSLLFLINQLDVVLAGHATALTWVKVGLTYLVPFCVSNYGLLVASRRRA